MPSNLKENNIKALFEQNYYGLVELSCRLVGSMETGEDLVQDVFVKLLDSNTFIPEDGQRAKSYLYAMVKNASLSHLRKLKVIHNYGAMNPLTELSDEDILENIIYAESINQLYASIRNLPQASQNIFNMAYLDEKSNLEVAEFYGISINTVKTQKRRAMSTIKKILFPVLRSIKVLLF
ncbi:MAG: sigma-70 family RNA polymerase sigma factor [Sphingobacterium sp.]|jgi:RNA polymerase sigma-70 factor (ECF subfamily)|uniref:sigma-70 family RNA polymerase sigma factor n=1 Tax=Sphingobacterium sp. TaxID=341027 RepID=UPI00282A13FD|nr:sigma-70 family RNA polymerase sigma factor [Sphingobacterium sp.]MDR0264503.1 sigma-70 family RNA polymerase sigma factor [Sphingobacterium sp.]